MKQLLLLLLGIIFVHGLENGLAQTPQMVSDLASFFNFLGMEQVTTVAKSTNILAGITISAG
jgi:hypothetical protein